MTQRVIKFRVWDTHDNTMSGGYDITDSFFNYKENRGSENGCAILMQFTGLLDKHGKDIYYGDLLRIKFKTQYYDLKAIYEVIDRGFTTQFLMRSLITPSEVFSDIRLNAAEDFEWFAGNRLEISHGAHNGRERSNDIEVIGNIYTTPELIENGNS